MIDQLKSELEELEVKKKEVQPKIEKINEEREEEHAKVNKKYDHLVSEINASVEDFEEKVKNNIKGFVEKVIMDEFDAKRSMGEYIVTEQIKVNRDFLNTLAIISKEFIAQLDKVISEAIPIENLAYDLDNIKSKYFN